jgi:outer membrane lipoprotein SlyB
MRNSRRVGVAVAAFLAVFIAADIVPPAFAQNYFTRPSGTSSAYMNCQNLALRKSGYQGGSNKGGGALEGAAIGAMSGAAIGSWNGNGGSGAAWGAAAGAIVGGSRRRRAEKEQNSKREEFEKTFQECMQYHAPRPAVTPVPNPYGATPIPHPANPYATPIPHPANPPAPPQTPESPHPQPT